ncbi:MAG: ComF family protein [Treponema sp.]|jgi:ComF family protein|nr:ComF family protein [Treponema sp.]
MKTHLFTTASGLLAELIFPRGCACCGKSLFRSEETRTGLCGACRSGLSAAVSADIKRCAVCGKPLVSERETCMACRRGPPHFFDRLFPVFPYRDEYRKLLRAYKFGSRRNLGHFLRECLVNAALSPFWENTLGFGPAGSGETAEAGKLSWVPVPPRPGKLRRAGWDQVEYLAKLLEKDGRPVCRCLKRLDSGVQKTLGREKRRINLRGKIQAGKDYLGGKRKIPETALVFDDVYTTGSTMDACAETLKSAGTTAVYGICLFYD